MYEDGSEAGPVGTYEIYKAEGDSLYKNGEFSKAIDSYTTALELREDDKNCLVARSRCYLMLGDNVNALKDAESSLAEEPNYHKGIYQKAEALYQKGEFEWSLMFYHRGHKLRPELQEFRLGIQKAQEAIDNSVGSPNSVQLTKEGDLTYFEKQVDNKPVAKTQRAGTYNRPASTKEKNKRKDPPKSAAKDKTIRQLLGEMYGDRLYLEMLLKETGQSKTRDPKSGLGQTVYNLAYDGISYLDKRTEFWRQQKPMYARKRDRLQKKSTSDKDKTSPNKYVVKELEKIDEEQSDGKFQESLKRAKKCLKTIENYPEDAIQNRMEVVATLHSNIGNAYLEMNELGKSQEAHEKDYNIGNEHNIEEAKSRALDNLGRVFARKGEYSKAINAWEKKIPMSKTPLETTWLYHEIGRCHLEIGNFMEAKQYGDKSVAAANEAGDDMWQLNATVLVAQSEVKLQDFQAALGSFETALDMAKVQRDEAAETAIKKAITEVNSKIVKSIKEDDDEDTRNEEVIQNEEITAEEPPAPVKEEPPAPVKEEPKQEEVKKEEPVTDESSPSESDKDSVKEESAKEESPAEELPRGSSGEEVKDEGEKEAEPVEETEDEKE